MKRKTDELMVSKTFLRKQTIQVTRGEPKEKSPLSVAVRQWVGVVSICLCVWAVLSPLFYEQFYHTAAGTGDFMNWLFWLACFLGCLLLFSVSATRQVIVETRKQYFPPANTKNTNPPSSDTLVRASSEPLPAQHAVLLRAATEGQETPPKQLVRAVEGAKQTDD